MVKQSYFKSHKLLAPSLLIILLIIHSYPTTALNIFPMRKLGEDTRIYFNHRVFRQPIIILEKDMDTLDLMKDLEDCGSVDEGGEKEEECMKRRMISEAHLDYIYTKPHKPNN